MARETFGEASERATPKRREEARREEKAARSTELTSALVLLAGVAALVPLQSAEGNDLEPATSEALTRGFLTEAPHAGSGR